MKFGLPISLILHSAVLGAGLIAFSGKVKPYEDSRIIPIELISIAKDTNISAAIRKPKEVLPEAEPDEAMTLQSPMQNAPEEADDFSERIDEPTKKVAETIVPDPTDTPREDTEITEPQKETVDEPVFDLDKLSGLVTKSRSTAPEKNQQETLQSEENLYRFAESARSGSGEGTKMTLTELDALKSAMYACWRMPADAKNPEKLIVTVEVKLLPGGFVESARVVNSAAARRNDPGNPFWDVAEQRAVSAVSHPSCAPYDFLPEDKYSDWRKLTLNFAPQL
ncbi:cell division and transport-associated protein TolA [Litorimonas taeanensis]|uniref:Cell division and transport-associated protein TolA n=1 Tax=Litorimonas taeanensis TaxID=568099 RepID=A0A420WLD3_9PROT|nr:cell division and transport-associated protein TolA [Litorimonas taeanensis]